MKYEAIVSTGEVIVREMNDKEIEQHNLDIAKIAAKEALEAEEIAKIANERALILEKLGITEAEAKLLLS